MGKHEQHNDRHLINTPAVLGSEHPLHIPHGYRKKDYLSFRDSDWFFTNLRVLLSHRWLILTVSLAVIGFAFIRASLKSPYYTAEATLQVSVYTPTFFKKLLEDPTEAESREYDYFNTQMKLLTSLPVADRALNVPGIKRSVSAYFSGGKDLEDKIDLKNKSSVALHKKDPASKYNHSVGELRQYLSLISVTPLKKTSLAKIKVTSGSPEFSARIANTHAEQYIMHASLKRQETSLENLAFLKSQAEELAQRVSEAEQNLAAYAEENAIVSLNKDENIVVQRMAELSRLLTAATAKRIAAEQQYKEALEGKGFSVKNFNDWMSRNTQVELEKAEAEYSQMLEKYTPQYTRARELKARIDRLHKVVKARGEELLKAMEADYSAELNTEKNLKEELEIQKSRAFELSRRQVQYNILQREYDSVKDLYQSVLRQLKESQIDAQSTGTNIKLVEYAAIPTSPSGPNNKLSIILALIMGPALGIALAFFLDFLDNTLKTMEEVRNLLGVPVIAAIPSFSMHQKELPSQEMLGLSAPEEKSGKVPPVPKKSKTQINQELFDVLGDDELGAELAIEPFSIAESAKPEQTKESIARQQPEPQQPVLSTDQPRNLPEKVLVLDTPNSVISEVFRTITTAIMLSSAEEYPRTLMVTSAKKREGKTTICTNLAATLAQCSGTTVLIDADLRRPTVHRYWDIEKGHVGLVDYLTGNSTLKQSTVSGVIDGLDIIPSGQTPPNPVELLGSKKMERLLIRLSKLYDHVIIDSPPVMPVTDPVLLSRSADAVLMVVRASSTTKPVAREAMNRLKAVGAKVIGSLLNDVNSNSSDYYYYKDAYNYYLQDEDEMETTDSLKARLKEIAKARFQSNRESNDQDELPPPAGI